MGSGRLGIGTHGAMAALAVAAAELASAPAAAAWSGHGGGWNRGGGWDRGGGDRDGWNRGGFWGAHVGVRFGGAPFGYYPGYYSSYYPGYYGVPAYSAYPYAAYASGSYAYRPYPYGYYPAVYPPPAVSLPPPPRPAAMELPPEQSRRFEVYFDFDKSAVTPAAAEIIRQAAESMRQARLTRISVIGHTDTVGSPSYDQSLSERRAAAVRRALIADGVAADEIEMTGVGKSGLNVTTGEDVREPRNRRVQILFPNDAEVAFPPASAERPAVLAAVAGCRTFQTTIMVDGSRQPAHGTACRQPDGTWKLMR